MKLNVLFVWMMMLGLVFSSCQHADPKPPEPEPKPEPRPEPEPEPEPPAFELGVVVVGDTGTGKSDQYRVAESMERYCQVNKCDVGLLLGDNIYEKGVKTPKDSQFQSKFEKPYANLDFKFKPTLGNHDAYGCWICQVQYSKYSDKWDMPAQYYTFQYDKYVEFFAIDSNWDYFRNPMKKHKQHDWLEDQLKTSEAKWKIVYGHHPVHSERGRHGDDMWMKKYLRPMLQKYKVDFYLAGHDHNKELTHKDGLAYVIAGSGAKLRGLKKDDDPLFAKSSLGFAHLLIKENELTLRFVGLNGEVEYERKYEK